MPLSPLWIKTSRQNMSAAAAAIFESSHRGCFERQPIIQQLRSDVYKRQVRAHWLQQWSEAIPGSDPARASVLLAPVAAAKHAVIYRSFLDNIEPSEQPYHRADPVRWLNRTACLLYTSRCV